MPYSEFLEFWGEPIYQGLAIIVIVEVFFMLTQLTWLSLKQVNSNYLTYRSKTFALSLGATFWESLEDDKDLRKWVRKTKSYPYSIPRDFFQHHFKFLLGDSKEKIIDIYRKLNFHKKDLKDLRAASWNKRMMALRRLSWVAKPSDKKLLMRLKDKGSLIRILAARILVEIGTPEDIVKMLKGVELTRRIMEQPFYAVFNDIPPEQYTGIMDHWRDFNGPIMQRILLISASEIIPDLCESWIEQAAEDESIELRIGACIAAGKLNSSSSLFLLLELIEDPDWRVRAQAVKALGARKVDTTIDNLAKCLRDPSYWVRQNAASALAKMGLMAMEKLKHLSENSDDKFARDAALQELEKYRLNINLKVAPV